MNEQVTAEQRDAQFAAEPLTEGMTIAGYAAVFDIPWAERVAQRAGYVESVNRGAFRSALEAGDDVPLLWQHDRNSLLATTAAGTLRLEEDERGLHVEADLPDTTLGRDVREHIRRGEVRGMSYGREIVRGMGSRDESIVRRNGVIHRSIANVRRLLDVTLTWEPSFASTSVELRSSGLAILTLRELGVDEASLQEIDDRPPSYRKTMLELYEREVGIR